MAMWKYTIESGSALHEAIYDGNTERTVSCLLKCYQELYNKLCKADKEEYEYEIEESIEILTYYEADPDDEDDVNYYLEEFYDLCDSVRAFIKI